MERKNEIAAAMMAAAKRNIQESATPTVYKDYAEAISIVANEFRSLLGESGLGDIISFHNDEPAQQMTMYELINPPEGVVAAKIVKLSYRTGANLVVHKIDGYHCSGPFVTGMAAKISFRRKYGKGHRWKTIKSK